jgi:hypothetical protein
MSENNEDALFKWHLQRLAQEDDDFFHVQCLQTITSALQTRNEKLETAPPIDTNSHDARSKSGGAHSHSSENGCGCRDAKAG